MAIYFLYLLSSLALVWSYAGYILALTYLAKKKGNIVPITNTSLPQVTIIIPCFNEAKLIRAKIKNLLALDYPEGKLTFTFIDGGSTDKTTKIIRSAASQNRRIKLVTTDFNNKIRQINKILPHLETDIIVISDVDAQLTRSTIKNMVKEFDADQRIAVVGTYTRPHHTLPYDAIYWHKQNQIRVLESDVFSSSIVIASCYAFKKNFLRQFPHNVVADDIYIAFFAQSKGLRVVYTNAALALELRAPRSFALFLYHKFRKAHAYIQEVLRFLPSVPYGNWPWRITYLTKFLQVVLTPLLLPAFLFLTIQFFLLKHPILPILSLTTLFILSAKVTQTLSQAEENLTKNIGLTTVIFITLNLILFLALLVYPFYRQSASYHKVSNKFS